jgi:hypothetical protein
MPPKQRVADANMQEFIIPTGSFEVPHGVGFNGRQYMEQGDVLLRNSSDIRVSEYDTWLLVLSNSRGNTFIDMRDAKAMPSKLSDTKELIPYFSDSGIENLSFFLPSCSCCDEEQIWYCL